MIPTVRLAFAQRLQGTRLAARRAATADDLQLMRAVAAGDRSALSKLYDRHSRLLYSICRRVLGDTGDAEELLHDIFLEVWSRSDRYDAARGSPRSYLAMLSWSRAIDRRRSWSSRPQMMSLNRPDVASEASDPSQLVDARERAATVRKALAELRPAQREALERSFYDGLSHAEVAEQLQKPLGTVKSHIRNGLIRLRNQLGTAR